MHGMDLLLNLILLVIHAVHIWKYEYSTFHTKYLSNSKFKEKIKDKYVIIIYDNRNSFLIALFKLWLKINKVYA